MTSTLEHGAPAPRDASSSRAVAGRALVGWAGLVAAALAVGLVWHPGYPDRTWLPPLHGHPSLPSPGIVLPVAVGLVAVVVLPRLAERLPWRTVLLLGWLGTATWSVALATSRGWGALAAPLATEHEYLAAIGSVGDDPLGWLRDFAGLVERLPTHAAGHPPLATLAFWALDASGLRGAGWAAALCIAAGSSAVAAVLVTVRALADEPTARRLVPFLVLAPFALTVATSADAIFLAVTAWGVAALALAIARGSVVLGVVAGMLLGVGLYLSYALVVMGALALAVLVAARPVRRAVAGRVVAGLAAGTVAVVAAVTLAGFWWFDGVLATASRWSDGTGSDRPYGFTVVGNLAVLALLVGPATAAALPLLRERALRLLVGGALVAVAALDLSGVTRGEVERIWLPLAPWVVVACAALPRRWTRRALVAQVAVAVAVQALVRLSW